MCCFPTAIYNKESNENNGSYPTFWHLVFAGEQHVKYKVRIAIVFTDTYSKET